MKPDALSNQISSIDKLHMVHFYHLSSADNPVYGILAYYRDKTINLINTDTHFTALFEKLVSVYTAEASSAEILADEETLQVLQNALSYSDGFYEKMLTSYSPVKTPMIAPAAFSHIYILPIVRYILNILYDGSDGDFSFLPRSGQWFGRGILDARKGGEELRFPYRIICHSATYVEVNINNVISAGNQLNILISFEREGISVSCGDRFHAYEGSLAYHISKDKAELSVFFTKKNEVLIDSRDTYPASGPDTLPESLSRLSGIPKENWSSFASPFNGRVFRTSGNNTEYRVFCSEDTGIRISLCHCFSYINGNYPDSLPFGICAFRLYEHSELTELHFLDLAAPGSGLYAARYAGNCYTQAAQPLITNIGE
ncbi:MAG: hypothetical protein K6B44_02650 [Lachnospiraceae bacterium]|nr:hypothetical protein [Lachnospiraceae bacterium]